MTLVKEGYRLLHAYDGAEALKVAREDLPDVITLDVMMPQLDGWSVLGKLKSDPDLAHIPVIMLTIVDERTMGYSLGAAEYMTKPVDRARLIDLLRRFASKSHEAVILVVDDDADVRHIVKSTVEKAGLKAAEASNGQAALDWLAANAPPALILLDLMMPVMDGFEFLEKVKEVAFREAGAYRCAHRKRPHGSRAQYHQQADNACANQGRAAAVVARQRALRHGPPATARGSGPGKDHRKRDPLRCPKCFWSRTMR